jgi:AraC-like DNA-binding protein
MNARFALCTGGSAHVRHGGACAVLSPGAVALIDCCRTASVLVSDTWTAWVVDASPAAVAQAIGRPLCLRAPHVVTGMALAEGLAGLVRAVLTQRAAIDQARSFVAFLERIVDPATGLEGGANVPSAPPHLSRVRELVEDRFARRVTLDELAAHARLSPLYLVRAFRSAFGMPPHEYQLNVRVHRARELLVAGHPASEVAVAVGFSDLSHLTRHFKRLIGLPPGEFAHMAGPTLHKAERRGWAANARDASGGT